MITKNRSLQKHRRFNDVLSIITAAIAVYILISPLLPNIALWLQQKTDKNDGYVYRTNLVQDNSPPKDLKPIPKENRLVIPSIQLDEEIHDGKYANTLNKGLWRRPHTSTPDQGGNTVVVGHRFTYSKPGTFFHLDKVKEGDRFSLYWQGKEYIYQVDNVEVVSPLALEIEKPTEQPMLTLYTCTPVWSAKQRLVIQARLIEDII